MKILITMILSTFYAFAHPVNYSIDLKVDYNETTKELTVKCTSDSRNKCGLHNFHLLDEKKTILTTAKFPFLKKQTKVKIDTKPSKMIFFLRKIPEHTYTVIIE